MYAADGVATQSRDPALRARGLGFHSQQHIQLAKRFSRLLVTARYMICRRGSDFGLLVLFVHIFDYRSH